MIRELTVKPSAIKILPANEIEEITQNVLMILTTNKYSVPLDRDLGVDVAGLDEPIGVAKTRLSADIAKAVRQQEPRARVVKCSFEGNPLDGELFLRVQIEIVEKNLRGKLV